MLSCSSNVVNMVSWSHVVQKNAVRGLMLDSSFKFFGYACQPVPIYAASFCHYLSQGDGLLDENGKELNGEVTEKAVWRGPIATGGMFASVRQCVKMVMVEMRCCQSQLLRWVLVGGH